VLHKDLIQRFLCYITVAEAIEVKGRSRLNFEAATSKFCNLFCKFSCQPRKSKTDFCMTNSSKVLIYLSFLLSPNVSNAKRKTSKSNKSELWNRFSYRGLPYFFEVGSQTFRTDYKILKLQPQNSTLIVLNGLKNGPPKHFKNSLKSMHLFQRLWGGMNRR
jgi:hypothetical protein